MPTAEDVKARIEASIPGATADVQSPDNVHFNARVVAEAFAGVPVSHEVLVRARRWWLRSAPPRTLVACTGSVTPCSG